MHRKNKMFFFVMTLIKMKKSEFPFLAPRIKRQKQNLNSFKLRTTDANTNLLCPLEVQKINKILLIINKMSESSFEYRLF